MVLSVSNIKSSKKILIDKTSINISVLIWKSFFSVKVYCLFRYICLLFAVYGWDPWHQTGYESLDQMNQFNSVNHACVFQAKTYICIDFVSSFLSLCLVGLPQVCSFGCGWSFCTPLLLYTITFVHHYFYIITYMAK